MDELRESSLLFSLESLLETERQRVEREAREAEQRQQQELKRVAELAERRRVAAQQEREARARRQALEQERERLEGERIDAMKRATIERARIEAESQARLAELEQRRQHELELSRLAARHSSGRYRSLFWLSAVSLVATLSLSCIAIFGFVLPAHARQEQQLRAVLGATEARVAASERALSAERSKSQALEERLAQAQAKAARDNPTTALPKAESAIAGKGPAKGRGTGEVARKPCRDDGDPLDGCVR